MPKKNLTKPLPKRQKQPTAGQIASFVRGGVGKDTTAAKAPKARLTVDLPREMHRRFKVACVIAGVKMNDEIRRFIERRCVELESSR